MGRSLSIKTNMHPFHEGTIDINRRDYDSLIRKTDLDMLEQMSMNHPVLWEIPTWNHQVIGKHDINDETMDIQFNALLKVKNEKGCTTTGMTIFL